jgi:hypothetical protein
LPDSESRAEQAGALLLRSDAEGDWRVLRVPSEGWVHGVSWSGGLLVLDESRRGIRIVSPRGRCHPSNEQAPTNFVVGWE